MNETEIQHTNSNQTIFDPKNYTQNSADRIIEKYPHRLPILIWEQGSGIDMKKRKFIVPKDITLGQFLYVVRKQMKNLSESDGLFIFITGKGVMLPVSELMSCIYNEHNDNGFLKFTVTKENTFG
jgi:GABA(A) receptor-associated protein